MGYSTNKRKNGIGITIALVGACILLGGATGWIALQGNTQVEQLQVLRQEAEALEVSKQAISTQVETIKAEKEALTQQIQELSKEIGLLKEQGIPVESLVPVAEEDRKYAYLTFDDGPSQNTIKILDFLKANNIKATFFVLEKDGYDDVYQRIVNEGHEIALHSTDHDYSRIYQTVDTFMTDMEDLSAYIQGLTGVESKVLRFPGGSNNHVSRKYGGDDIMDHIIQEVEEQGYAYFDWNVDSMDAAKGLQDKDVIVSSVLNQAKYQKTAVILMHDAARKTTTVDALPEVVEGLKEQGFFFRGLSEETPPVRFK